MEIYVVSSGDTVDAIAASYGISTESIIYNNQLVYPYRLAVGQALLLSVGESAASDAIGYHTGGYAYPFINQNVLEETVPFLTSLFVFSYGFTENGELIPPALDDGFMIAAAKNAGARPILTLTPFGPDGQFNNYLITSLLHNPESRQRLQQNLLTTLQSKNFAGVDIDFEFILPNDRLAFAQFAEETNAFLSPYGYTVSVALAPKTSDSQKGLLYEGKDYELLGKAADSVLLMTYEWGYTYGPPMAVAPLNKVREVVEYAVSRIAPSKIDLGIPNYGYDWTLPYEKGLSRARTIGSLEAVQIAVYQGVPISFDETAKSPYFRYEEAGELHEVWFEDVRSLRAKYDLLPEYGLRGIGVWQVMKLFRAAWLLFQDSFGIIK